MADQNGQKRTYKPHISAILIAFPATYLAAVYLHNDWESGFIRVLVARILIVIGLFAILGVIDNGLMRKTSLKRFVRYCLILSPLWASIAIIYLFL